MLVLGRSEIERLLDLDALVDALASAMTDLSAGRATQPPRTVVRTPAGMLATMPSHLPSAGVLATKLVTVYPPNAAKGKETHQAVVLCLDPDDGTPLALLDGTHITATRTAAGSALATRLLARDDAAVLAVVGSGVQAREHLRAVPRVMRAEAVRVAARRREGAEALASRFGELPVVVADSPEDACRGADVVCVCTHSPDPVVLGDWVGPGTHVNSVGVNLEGREIDEALVRRALVVVESRDAALGGPGAAGANELLWPIRDGAISAGHVRAEIGELLAGTKPGRTSPDQITLYKSVGVAVQDAAAAALVLAEARKQGFGTEIDVGG